MIADPPMTLPTMIPILEDVGLELSAWDVFEELATVAVPKEGGIECEFDGTVLELAKVLMEFVELTELVAVSGKIGSDDERDILELVDETGGIHTLLGASECHE